MKLVKIYESNVHGQPKMVEFHVGMEEMKLLLGLLFNYSQHCPKGEDWKPDNVRANNMHKALKKALEKPPQR